MRKDLVLDLADCTEFRQALQARPPRGAHGAMTLLIALLGTALVWSATTTTYLVVRGPGRVRPVTTPVKVFNAARGEVLGAGVGGRVAEVNFRQGAQVRRGDVLVRLETERLDNEIARRRRTARAGEEELAKLAHLGELLTRQFEATRARAEAELEQARGSVRRAKEQREVEVRLAQVALRTAEGEEVPLRRLAERKAVAPAELLKAAAQTREAKAKLDRARIAVDEGGVKVAQRALELADREHTVKREELELRRGVKRGEAEAARLELANLELERRQAAIPAPVDGVVTAGDVKVGDVLEPGKPVAEIAEQQGFRFEAAVPSEEVGRLRVGMPTRIKLDAYDYQRYGTLEGTVCFISPDSGVVEGQRAAIYTVKVAVLRDDVGRGAYRGRVKLGMAGQVEIVTGEESLLVLLVRRICQSISLG